MVTFTEGKKKYIFILAPIILILLKLIYIIKVDLWFRFGRDETRHLLLINEIYSNGIPSLSINLPGYPPGLHLFFVVTSIITGIDVKIVWYLFSLLLISCIIMVVWIILTKYINIKYNFVLLILIGLYALLFEIPSPVPSYVVYYVELPILTLIILRYLKYKKIIEFVPLILIMITLTTMHFSSVIFIIFVMFALILFYAANIKEKTLLMQCLVVLILSWFCGFLVYLSLMPSFAYAANKYFLIYTNPFVFQIIFLGIVIYISILVWFSKRPSNYCMTTISQSNHINKIINVLLSISILCIIIGSLYSIIYSSVLFFALFIKPTIPDLSIAYTFKLVSDHISLKLLTELGFNLFLIFSIFEMKKHKVWDASYIVIFSYIFPIFLILIALPIISIFYEPIYSEHVINRLPLFATMSVLITGTIYLSRYVKSMSGKPRNISKMLIICLLLITFSANFLQQTESYPIKEHTSQPLYWIIENTDMKINTMNPLPGTNTIYHEYYISNKYNLDLGILKARINLLQSKHGDKSLSPVLSVQLLNITKIYNLPIKWSPVLVDNSDNKIFASNAINFYKKR